ncbi:MAG: DUF3299 domain-containing protein [Pseudomonadota bacterium]
MFTRALMLAFAIALPAQAQSPGQAGPHVPSPGLDPAAAFKPLAERKDVVSWKLLAQVELVRMKDRYVAQFSDNVAALNRKEVKVQGFMMPLELGDKQTHFVLSAMPQTCAFCMPGGPESMVEVKSKQPVKYTFEPLVLTGRLEVLKDDPSGVFYRLTNAVPAR